MTKARINSKETSFFNMEVDLPEPIYSRFTSLPPIETHPTDIDKYRAQQEFLGIVEARGRQFNVLELAKFATSHLVVRTALDRLGYQYAQITLDESDRRHPFFKVELPSHRSH